MDELGTKVAVLETCYIKLEQVVIDEKRRLNGNLERLDKRLAELSDKFDAAKESSVAAASAAALAASAKPTWGVAAAITALTSLATGLIMWIVTH